MDRDEFIEAAENRILAIFPQKKYHHNAYIIGGRKGLEALRDALNEVLADPDSRAGHTKVSMVVAHPGDDETYSAFVMLDYDLEDIESNPKLYSGHDLPLPYYDKGCAEELKDGAVSLSPPEQHIMDAGVHSHMFFKQFDEQEKKKKKKD